MPERSSKAAHERYRSQGRRRKQSRRSV